jgi:hypothetical protein
MIVSLCRLGLPLFKAYHLKAADFEVQDIDLIIALTHRLLNEYTRTAEKPIRGRCQGPDKIFTFGADVCADPDNFRLENPDMYVSQSGQF